MDAPRPSASLAGPDSAAEAHAGDGDRNFEMDRLLGEARAEHHVGRAFLAVAFERIAADRGAEKQEIVEMGDFALGAKPANIVDAGRGGAVDLRDRIFVEGRGVCAAACVPSEFRRPSIRLQIVHVEVVELPRRAVAAKLRRIDLPGQTSILQQFAELAPCARRETASRCNRSQGCSPCRARRGRPHRASRRAHRRCRRAPRAFRPAP